MSQEVRRWIKLLAGILATSLFAWLFLRHVDWGASAATFADARPFYLITINIFNQDAECDLDFCANTARDARIDVAVKNNFGFGGTNGTLVFKRA